VLFPVAERFSAGSLKDLSDLKSPLVADSRAKNPLMRTSENSLIKPVGLKKQNPHPVKDVGHRKALQPASAETIAF
jgi:hypothetical protein